MARGKDGRKPRAALHFGRMKDFTPDKQVDLLTLSTHSAVQRALERRRALGIASTAYWPTVSLAVSIEELRLLVAALPQERTPERLRPLRAELTEALVLGSVHS